MIETYEHWVKRTINNPKEATKIKAGDIVKSSSGEPFGTVDFVKIQKKYFAAEIGKKGNYYIYHFYPRLDLQPTDRVGNVNPIVPGIGCFYRSMSDALVEVFKREDQIEASWTHEMKAWAVKVSGWVNNVWGDDLALRVIDRIDELISNGVVL